jgi:hypothetical protein
MDWRCGVDDVEALTLRRRKLEQDQPDMSLIKAPTNWNGEAAQWTKPQIS